jgi:transcriptional regulator with XRE-family HTH domain
MENDDTLDRASFLRALAMQISSVRKSRGYSQDRLALEAGLTRGALSKIEKGTVDPRASTLACIALALGVPVSSLFPPLNR